MTRANTKKTDNLVRCSWPGIEDPLYTRYHDEEWGVPKTTEQELFEKLILEGFQAGLSWLTILRKRDAFRRAFDNFEADRIARYNDRSIRRLMADANIIRNLKKIEATVSNAQAYLRLTQTTTLSDFLWEQLDGRPIINTPRTMSDVPASTDLSQRISKALKQEGFKFVGPTTTYAYLQSCGFINDHLTACHRHAPCAKIQRQFVKSRNPAN